MYSFIAYSGFFYRANTLATKICDKKSTVIIVANVYRDTRVTGSHGTLNFSLVLSSFEENAKHSIDSRIAHDAGAVPVCT